MPDQHQQNCDPAQSIERGKMRPFGLHYLLLQFRAHHRAFMVQVFYGLLNGDGVANHMAKVFAMPCKPEIFVLLRQFAAWGGCVSVRVRACLFVSGICKMLMLNDLRMTG
jgi:hypothetical protein